MTERKWLTADEEKARQELIDLAATAGTTSKPILHGALTQFTLGRVIDNPLAMPRQQDYELQPYQHEMLDKLRKMAADSNFKIVFNPRPSPEMRLWREYTNIDDHFIYGMPLVVDPKLDPGEFKFVMTKPRQGMSNQRFNFEFDWPMRPGKNTIKRTMLEEMSYPARELKPKAKDYFRVRPTPTVSSYSSVVGFQSSWNSFGLDEWEPWPLDLYQTPIPFNLHHFTRKIRATLGASQ